MNSFSIVIPTFNNSFYLQQTVKSVLNQIHNNFEILIIDDGSTDDTSKIFKNIKDKRIKYLYLNHTGIPAKVRNIGIRKSNYDWICFLDSDDIWSPSKLCECNIFIEQGYDFICHDMDIINEKNNQKFKVSFFKKDISFSKLLNNGNIIFNSSVVVKKDLLFDVGLLNENKSIIAAEDYNLWLKITKKSKNIIFINKKLGKYRIHKSSISNKNMYDCTFNAIKEFKKEININDKKYLLSNLSLVSSKNFFNSNFFITFKRLKFSFINGPIIIKLASIKLLIILIINFSFSKIRLKK